MKKRLCASALALMLLLTASSASAQLRRGDRGDEVTQLQQMLLETGWLFELPDGRFGPKTEQAVRDYERHAGLTADGVADDAMLDALLEDWCRLTMQDGLAQDGRYPVFCCFQDTEDGVALDYCEVHAGLFAQTSALGSTGSAADAQQALELWRAEIDRLYDRWIACTDEELHAGIRLMRTQYLAMADAAQQSVGRYYGTFQIEPGEAKVCAAVESQLRGHAAWLCALISGALAAQ